MTLPSSGVISARDINIELRKRYNDLLDATDLRLIAAKPAGSISYSDCYGKNYSTDKPEGFSTNTWNLSSSWSATDGMWVIAAFEVGINGSLRMWATDDRNLVDLSVTLNTGWYDSYTYGLPNLPSYAFTFDLEFLSPVTGNYLEFVYDGVSVLRTSTGSASVAGTLDKISGDSMRVQIVGLNQRVEAGGHFVLMHVPSQAVFSFDFGLLLSAA